MLKSRSFVTLVLVALVGVSSTAQIVISPPNFGQSLVAASIPANGASMAADRFGNVYIVNDPGGSVSPSIVQVRPDGTVHPAHATGFGVIGQLAYNPTDGYVYVSDYSPLLTVVLTRIWRIEPTGGKTLAENITIISRGFTIDNHGNYYLGAVTGLSGGGLYRFNPLVVPPINLPQYLGPGFGQNRILQSLVTGDVLIADGLEVRRWSPSAVAPLPYYLHPPALPNEIIRVNSLARTPFNQLGSGAMIGVHDLTTVCLCGTGTATSAGPIGQNQQLFAQENFTYQLLGMQAICSGLRQDLYWYTTGTGIVPGTFGQLYRIRQLPAVGSPGSLFFTYSNGTATWDLSGAPAGGDPFLLGVQLGFLPNVTSPLFVPPYGLLDLDILAPNYIALLDGIGVFGPPNPFAVFPPGGHYVLSLSVPPLPIPVSGTQFIAVNPNAPNGLAFVSNVATVP